MNGDLLTGEVGPITIASMIHCTEETWHAARECIEAASGDVSMK
jgi:hypothetical protein